MADHAKALAHVPAADVVAKMHAAGRAWPPSIRFPIFPGGATAPLYMSRLQGPIVMGRTGELTHPQVVDSAKYLLQCDPHKACQMLSAVGTYKGIGQAQRVIEEMHVQYKNHHSPLYASTWKTFLQTLRIGSTCVVGNMAYAPCIFPTAASAKATVQRVLPFAAAVAPNVAPPLGVAAAPPSVAAVPPPHAAEQHVAPPISAAPMASFLKAPASTATNSENVFMCIDDRPAPKRTKRMTEEYTDVAACSIGAAYSFADTCPSPKGYPRTFAPIGRQLSNWK